MYYTSTEDKLKPQRETVTETPGAQAAPAQQPFSGIQNALAGEPAEPAGDTRQPTQGTTPAPKPAPDRSTKPPAASNPVIKPVKPRTTTWSNPRIDNRHYIPNNGEPIEQPDLPETEPEGTAGGAGSSTSAGGTTPTTPTPAAPPPKVTPRAMGYLGTPGGAGSFRNIQQFLATNAPAEAEFAQRVYANPMEQQAMDMTGDKKNTPTMTQYSASMNPTEAAKQPSTAITQAQAGELGYRLGTGGTPGAYQAFLQGRGQGAGTSRLDAYLYGATPGGAKQDVQAAGEKYAGLLGLIKNQIPKGATVNDEGIASMPTTPADTTGGNTGGVDKGPVEGQRGTGVNAGKIWDGAQWVSAAAYTRQQQRDRGYTDREGRYHPAL